MKFARYTYLVLMAALLSVVACNDKPTVEPLPTRSEYPYITAYIDKDTVMIGDRFMLNIEVDRDVMQNVLFPTFKPGANGEENTGSSSVELIKEFEPDTIKGDGRHDRLRKRYELAIFDEGRYNFGRGQALYIDKNIVDTIFSEQEMSIFVNTIQMDSTATNIKPLKGQKWPSFHFGEIAGYLGIALCVAVVLAGIIWLLVWSLHKRGKRVRDIFRKPPPPPPHIVAIEALEALYNQKLWQSNKHKQYYSALSDILRTYIADSFSVSAMEMTTDEIAESLNEDNLSQKAKMDLISVLRDADLVKFAKATPEAEDNELAYNKAYYFVEETKPVTETQKVVEDEHIKNEKR